MLTLQSGCKNEPRRRQGGWNVAGTLQMGAFVISGLQLKNNLSKVWQCLFEEDD